MKSSWWWTSLFLWWVWLLPYLQSFRLSLRPTQLSLSQRKLAFTRNAVRNSNNGATTFYMRNGVGNTIGTFADVNWNTSFLHSYMLATTVIDNVEYGVGIPVNHPVELVFFENMQVKSVTQDDPHYIDLLEYISCQLEPNDASLHPSPVFTTMSGNFGIDEDEESASEEEEQFSDHEEEEEDEETEVELQDIVQEEIENEPEYEDNSEEEDEEEEEEEEFENENGDDYNNDENETESRHYNSNDNPNDKLVSDDPSLPPESKMTAEDFHSLKRESKLADRIFQYAADVKYLGTFQYLKRNYHLLKLLEVSNNCSLCLLAK
jgi:hypothetical protein